MLSSSRWASTYSTFQQRSRFFRACMWRLIRHGRGWNRRNQLLHPSSEPVNPGETSETLETRTVSVSQSPQKLSEDLSV